MAIPAIMRSVGTPEGFNWVRRPLIMINSHRMKTHAPTNPTATASGYIRVSTQEQAAEGVSLDAQRDKFIAYCRLYAIKLIDIKVDEGISGTSGAAGCCQCLKTEARSATRRCGPAGSSSTQWRARNPSSHETLDRQDVPRDSCGEGTPVRWAFRACETRRWDDRRAVLSLGTSDQSGSVIRQGAEWGLLLGRPSEAARWPRSEAERGLSRARR